MGQDTSELRDEVAAARESLGDTVSAIAYKANAPRRAKARAFARIAAVRRGGVRAIPPKAAVAAVAGLAVLVAVAAVARHR